MVLKHNDEEDTTGYKPNSEDIEDCESPGEEDVIHVNVDLSKVAFKCYQYKSQG